MAELLKISTFLGDIAPHAGKDKGANQWGYVMGTYGQTCTKARRDAWAKANYPATWEDYSNHAARWDGRRVFDCNGVAEGIYLDHTGVSINTRSRTNFSTWCDGHNGSDMAKMPQQPGTAVFHYSDSLGYIHHVGYLWKKYGPGPRQWYVIECAGVDSGLIVTDFARSSWNRWGQMRKYFDYDLPVIPAPATPTPPPVLPTAKGSAIVTANALNVRKGPGTNYAALKTIHLGDVLTLTGRASGTWVEIVSGTGTAWASSKYLKVLAPAAQPKTATVTATALNVRSAPGTASKVLRTVHRGDVLTLTGRTSGNWLEIVNSSAPNAPTAWVSALYVKR